MRAAKVLFVPLVVALIGIGVGSNALAFHSGGVAECGGCHSMHSANQLGSFLLIGKDQSSTCLTCHEQAGLMTPSSYHMSTAPADMPAGVPPKQRTPGGDFGWLRKDYTFTVRGTTTTELGETHGHNIVAADAGYVADTTNTQAPGGTYTSANLGCQSCHDPHGRYRRLSDGTIAASGAPIIGSGSYNNSADPAAGQAVGVYRLLAGIGYNAGSGVFFTKDPPAAVAPSGYNATEATNQMRVAYGKGMAGWCAQCHPDMHTTSGRLVHPVDQGLGGTIKTIYDQYRKSGDMTGTNADSYNSIIPFEENSADYATLKLHAQNNNSYLTGPSDSSMVSCLSCHRAHASGWMEGLRFNIEGEFMVYNGLWPGTDTTPTVPQFARGRTSVETAAAYYDRPATQFGTYQRVLCNKCHAKD
jgi:predicted CXXCH cytochrome family protein